MNGDRNLSWADQCGANQDLKGNDNFITLKNNKNGKD